MDEEERMPTFFYFYFPLLFIAMVIAIVYGFKRAKKQILADAEAKGWKNIKVRQGFWDWLVTYQDENGAQTTTHCSTPFYKTSWMNDTDDLYLDQKTYKAKTKNWKIISTVCGLCFLILFIGYEYQQISNTIFRYSFVKNGEAVRIDNQFAIGIESILRGEETLKLVNTLYPDLDPPQESKELAIIKLKIKNISKKTSDKIRINDISLYSGASYSFLIHLDGALNSIEPVSLAAEEVVFKSFIGEVNRNKPISKISPLIEISGNYNDFSSYSLRENPLMTNSFFVMIYWLLAFVLIYSALRKRWHLLLKSKKTRGYIILPLTTVLIIIITILTSTPYSSYVTHVFIREFFFQLFMILLFTITWWNIILLASTKPEPATT
jgi:hypothetical protein